MRIIEEHYVDTINELLDLCWSGAVPVLEEIIEQGREREAMDYIEEVFCDEDPSDTAVNDYIWFDLADDMGLYDEDDEEDEDDE